MRRRLLGCVLAAAMALVLAACGGGDEEGDTEVEGGETEVSAESFRAEESIDEFATRFEEAITALQDRDCETFGDFFALGDVLVPCEQRAAQDFAEFEVTGAEEYDGLGGVVTFEAAAGPGAAIAVPDVFGNYEPSALIPAPVELGTEPDDLEQREADLGRLIDALINEDCEAFFTYALTASDDQQAECRRAFDSIDEEAAAELGAAGSPELVGGNEFAVFYTLSSEDPQSFRVYYSIPDDQDPIFIGRGRRLGPTGEVAAQLEREQLAELLVALNTSFDPARQEFLQQVGDAIEAEDLEAIQSLSRSYRDAAFELDARLREIELPDAVATDVNAVLTAISETIATLDEVAGANSGEQAAQLAEQALEQDAALDEAINELIDALLE